MREFAAAALMLAMTGAGLAQEQVIDQTKVYVSRPEACAALQKQGLDAFSALDFTALTFPDGIQALEHNCKFYDIKSRAGSGNLFVSAICENPGDIFADTLAITPYDENTIQVVSTYIGLMISTGEYEVSSEGTAPGATLYHRCDNLSELPR